MKKLLIFCLTMLFLLIACTTGAPPSANPIAGGGDTQATAPGGPTATSRLHVPVMQNTYTPTTMLTFTPTLTPFSTDVTKPLTFSGVGNAYIDVVRDIAQIKYTGTGEFKLIANHRPDWVILDTTGDYSGTRWTDFWDENDCTAERSWQDCQARNMEVITDGSWEISQVWLNDAKKYNGHKINGNGDKIFETKCIGCILTEDLEFYPFEFSFNCSDCSGGIKLIMIGANSWINPTAVALDTAGPFLGNVVDPINTWPENIAIEANGNWSIELIHPKPV